ncbi:DUF4856 domain-containing protein [Sanyastnella coralliicola]|uniref:DUF4856 domain-containing protein n=1 Tax=Sanyastnella coralliicola TaxID=3069118 RepID=UPI0027BA38D8|nr:DUF4856 domain-containing protein [Longitalea sp. SCSIO 12813]
MKRLILPVLLILLAVGCKEDKDELVINPPADNTALCEEGDYCFERNGNATVNYSGQIARLNQLEEMTTYMKTANTSGTAVDAAVLLDMFNNGDGNGSTHFSADAAVAGKQLENKCFLGTLADYQGWMQDLATASTSTTAGSNGTAGVVVSTTNPSKQYLLDENGVEHIQLIEKGLMGDVFYYQAMETYINGVEDGSFDNAGPVDEAAGKYYTEAEHKFDEAFGYFGIPTDFPTDYTSGRFHGKYCNSRDGALGTNSIFEDFIAARTAITAGTDVMPSTDEIRIKWHKVCAGTAIHYCIGAKEDIDDPALKCHQLSEAYAFIGNLLHNRTDLALTPTEVDEARALLGTNWYETTADDIDACIAYLIDRTEIELTDLPNL